MKKTVLKEIIKSVVAQKLAESKGGNPANYGYVISGKGTNDPVLQLIGYGNMPASEWKKKIEKEFKEILAFIESENWRNAAHLLDRILVNSVAMMDEIYSSKPLSIGKLNEEFDTNSATSANPTVSSPDPHAVELEKLQKQLDDTTNRVKTAESNIAKRMDTVNKANKRDELTKQQFTKRQGPIIRKIEQLKKKVSDKNHQPLSEISAANEPVTNPSYKDVKIGDWYISHGAFVDTYISTVLEVEPIENRFSKPDRVVAVKIQVYDMDTETPTRTIVERKKMWVSQLLKGLV